ncbi:MAG: oxygen-independent coproporphyrinogen-3 oxidase [Chlamydiales bacterium]|jgi:oxygen-independent coproporphyrinogen-3 oxidase
MSRLDPTEPPSIPEREPEEGTPLYVHLPFCAAKCHYCDFFSVPDAGQDVDGMIETMLTEIRRRAPRRPRTVFLGGGTPSLLSIPQLRRFLDELHAQTGFRDSAVEVTAECNPESLDRDKARAMLDLGVNRLSIGFQALDQGVLELFGRVHAVEDSFRAFEAAREAGVKAINIDMIYAWPDQTLEGWVADLERVLALRPEHLAAYNLTYEEGTRFTTWLEDGRLKKSPEDLELALFETVRSAAQESGMGAYEISNYSANGQECGHNLNYWANGPYVGVGPSAVSYTHLRRAGNPRGLNSYRRAVERGGDPAGWDEMLTPEARLAETWWLGLRLKDGIDPVQARASAQFPQSASDPCVREAAKLVDHGLLEEHAGRFRLTARGLPLADWVAKELLVPGD